MSFQQGLSGLNAASKGLDVIGHNIANANTTGMKSSRAEFAELYASSLSSAGGTGSGIGVTVNNVSQQFSQGNLGITGNDLDLAINGSGFFVVHMPDGSSAYTRAGMFTLDENGYVVTSDGAKLQGKVTDPVTGTVSVGDLSLPTGKGVAGKQTTAVTAELNLDTATPIAASTTPPTPVTTYGTSLNVYDSQGAAIPVGLYFSKTAANTWNVYADYPQGSTGTGTLGAPIGAVTFDAYGALNTTTPSPLTLTGVQVITDATPPFNITLDLSTMTQDAKAFTVTNLTQDGQAPGQLTGIAISDDGNILARFSNGATQSAGQVQLANFRNVQGLEPISGTYWKQTFSSGTPVVSNPGAGNFGSIRSGALEDSNVDLTAELVNMMTAQRAYQANAQTIKTQDQVMSTLVNLR
ncbi:flagellar hook protein FlgE [Ramlibacter sp. H39-3-26]|uniref:flagellar hook protein FlgE n=1 Tax=Curvibacter soli TaxID=3031331 RepID=UPI0023DBB124|nr:flagellar hook protein FlgE [Ramlibacter sp. H39-3-26]MDF1485803.1 flagellar hook protein FlgE [Ramlibacter sp. H39-3-26]